jgi:hypothetical protein
MRSLAHSRKPIEFDGFNRVGFEAVRVKRKSLGLDAVIRCDLEGVGYGE